MKKTMSAQSDNNGMGPIKREGADKSDSSKRLVVSQIYLLLQQQRQKLHGHVASKDLNRNLRSRWKPFVLGADALKKATSYNVWHDGNRQTDTIILFRRRLYEAGDLVRGLCLKYKELLVPVSE